MQESMAQQMKRTGDMYPLAIMSMLQDRIKDQDLVSLLMSTVFLCCVLSFSLTFSHQLL